MRRSAVRLPLRPFLPLSAILLAALTAFAGAPAAAQIAVPLEAEVRVPPTPVTGTDGAELLVYELHLTNVDPRGRTITLTAVEVLRGDAESDEGAAPLAAGTRGIVFFALSLPAGEVPASLGYVVRFALDGREEPLWLRPAPVELPSAAPIRIGPPLRGGRWVAGNGPGNDSGHRHALIPFSGRLQTAQRFAIDWLQLGEDGRPYAGDPKDNASWHGYGAELLAVADNGHVYMQTLGFFRTLEDGTPRSDSSEATAYAFQKHGHSLELQIEDEWRLLGTIDGAVRAHDPDLEAANVYCLQARGQSQCDDTWSLSHLGYGESFVVFHNPAEFLHRFKIVAEAQGHRIEYSCVDYVDKHHYHGPMGAFRKFGEWRRDLEFRILVRPGLGAPLSLRLGDLTDIAAIGPTQGRIKILRPSGP